MKWSVLTYCIALLNKSEFADRQEVIPDIFLLYIQAQYIAPYSNPYTTYSAVNYCIDYNLQTDIFLLGIQTRYIAVKN